MVYVPANDGRWVSENFARLAELVNSYDEFLQLEWIPPDKITRDDKKSYRVVDVRTGIPVFYADPLDTPVDILARLIEGDNKQGDVLKRLEAHNAAVEAFKLKEQIEVFEEAADQVKFLVGSPLNYVKFNGKKLDDQRRPVE